MVTILHGFRISTRTLALVASIALAGGLLACAPATEEAIPVEGEPLPTEEEPTADPMAVQTAWEAFQTAWEEENQEVVMGYFTDDAIAYDPVPPGKFQGTEEIATWVSDSFEQLDGISIGASEILIDTEGRVAWLTGRFVFAAQPTQEGAEPIEDEGYLSMVWVLQEDGSYASPLFHASNLPEAPEE